MVTNTSAAGNWLS